MVSKEPDRLPTVHSQSNGNSEKTPAAMTVRSVLLNRNSPDIESRLKRRRNRTHQVRFKDLDDGDGTLGERGSPKPSRKSPTKIPHWREGLANGPSVVGAVRGDMEGTIGAVTAFLKRAPPHPLTPGPTRRCWVPTRPCSLTLPLPHQSCKSTAIQTSPSLQKPPYLSVTRTRSHSLCDSVRADWDAEDSPDESPLAHSQDCCESNAPQLSSVYLDNPVDRKQHISTEDEQPALSALATRDGSCCPQSSKEGKRRGRRKSLSRAVSDPGRPEISCDYSAQTPPVGVYAPPSQSAEAATSFLQSDSSSNSLQESLSQKIVSSSEGLFPLEPCNTPQMMPSIVSPTKILPSCGSPLKTVLPCISSRQTAIPSHCCVSDPLSSTACPPTPYSVPPRCCSAQTLPSSASSDTASSCLTEKTPSICNPAASTDPAQTTPLQEMQSCKIVPRCKTPTKTVQRCQTPTQSVPCCVESAQRVASPVSSTSPTPAQPSPSCVSPKQSGPCCNTATSNVPHSGTQDCPPFTSCNSPAQCIHSYEAPTQSVTPCESLSQSAMPCEIPTLPVTPCKTPLQPIMSCETPTQPITHCKTPTQVVTPCHTPVQPVTPCKTPTQAVTPCDNPIHPVTPSKTPSQAVTPCDNPIHPVTPSKTPSQAVTPCDAPLQSVAPCKTHTQAVTPCEIPIQSVAACKTLTQPVAPCKSFAQSVTPLKTPTQPVTPCKTPMHPVIPCNTPTQTCQTSPTQPVLCCRTATQAVPSCIPDTQAALALSSFAQPIPPAQTLLSCKTPTKELSHCVQETQAVASHVYPAQSMTPFETATESVPAPITSTSLSHIEPHWNTPNHAVAEPTVASLISPVQPLQSYGPAMQPGPYCNAPVIQSMPYCTTDPPSYPVQAGYSCNVAAQAGINPSSFLKAMPPAVCPAETAPSCGPPLETTLPPPTFRHSVPPYIHPPQIAQLCGIPRVSPCPPQPPYSTQDRWERRDIRLPPPPPPPPPYTPRKEHSSTPRQPPKPPGSKAKCGGPEKEKLENGVATPVQGASSHESKGDTPPPVPPKSKARATVRPTCLVARRAILCAEPQSRANQRPSRAASDPRSPARQAEGQSDTLRQVQELLGGLVSGAKCKLDLAKAKEKLLGPHGPLYDIGTLQSQLHSLEGVLETSQNTIKVLLDVIQDLEKKEAERDGRHSYRTGQDIENCGTCRDCACIIYSVEHDFRQQEGQVTRAWKVPEHEEKEQSSPQLVLPPRHQESPQAMQAVKKSRKKCFWFL